MAESQSIVRSYVLKLEDIGRATPGVGIKAGLLGDLIKAGTGFEVSSGFVVKSDAWEKFLRMNRLEPKIKGLIEGIDVNDIQALAVVSGQVQNMIEQSQFPEGVENEIGDEYEELSVGKEVREVGGAALDLIKAGRSQVLVSVRPSTFEGKGNAPNSGILFNLQGQEVSEAVKTCWASMFLPHNIFYRKVRSMDTIPKIGVVIQKMVEPEKSGKIFTSWPMSPEQSAMLIEASWGLGDMITSGTVIPDEYAINRETGRVIEKTVSKKLQMRRTNALSGKAEKENVLKERVSKQVLDDIEAKKLWQLARKTEEHYGGQPQVIDWCEQRNKIFIMKTRSMPALKNRQHASLESAGVREGDRPILSGVSASPGVVAGTVKIVLDPNGTYEIGKGDILVTKMPGPELLPLMKKAGAIVSDFGGRSSCNASMSREMGLPGITGTETATNTLNDGQEIVVDAINGNIYTYNRNRLAEPQVQNYHGYQGQPMNISGSSVNPGYRGQSPGYGANPNVSQANFVQPNVSDSFIATEVKVTLSFPEPVNTESSDGVGLLKAEHMLTESGKHPVYLARTAPEELVQNMIENIGKVAKAYYPKQVWYRLMNARTDEFRELEGGSEDIESNPMLGWHGIRRSLDQPDVFRYEIETIRRLYQQGLNNVAIMLPFVSKVSELRKVKDIVRNVFSSNGQGIPQMPIIGIIVETPASALEIESFCREGIGFVSIDLDNLTRLTLAVDNENPKTTNLYSETDPAVISLIRHVTGVCKRYQIKTSVFGEATNNPNVIDMLVGLGIGSISAESDTFRQIRDIVARSEKKLLLDRARGNNV
jgi:pyruvate,water dikinase